MIQRSVNLNRLPVNGIGLIRQIAADEMLRRRLLDLGMTANTPIKVVMKSPAGDPTAYLIRGTVIALRSDDAAKIIVDII